MPHGDTRSAGSSSARTPHDRDRTSVEKPISFASWRHQDHPISIRAEDRDPTATTIRGAYVVEAPPFDQTATDGDSGSRLTRDNGLIVTRAWPDCGKNRGLF